MTFEELQNLLPHLPPDTRMSIRVDDEVLHHRFRENMRKYATTTSQQTSLGTDDAVHIQLIKD